jgi:hypothetical protein
MMLLPESSLFIDSEEKNGTRGSCYETCVEKQVHRTEIGLYDALPAAFHGLSVDGDAMTLSVEGGAVAGFFAVEGLDWEVQLSAIWVVNFSAHWSRCDLSCGYTFICIFVLVHEVVLLFLLSVVSTNEN